MTSLAIICLAASGVYANGFNLRGFAADTTGLAVETEVVGLKLGGDERRRADGKEELTVTLATGEEVILPLTEDDDMRRFEVCGSYHYGEHDVMVTGCHGDDRAVTIGGQGSWEFEAASGHFRRLDSGDVHDTCSGVVPPDDDVDAVLMNKAKKAADESGIPIAHMENRDELETEVRYYYDQTLLERFDGDHARAKAAVIETHSHAKVIMRHPSIGRLLHLVLRIEPHFVDLSLDPNGDTLISFREWLEGRNLCEQSQIAFHHLVTNFGNDGTGGIAYIGTACHGRCFNSAMTEFWYTPAQAAATMVHEFGHNIGAIHTFDPPHEGRNCHGVMSYGERPNTWSECSKESWTADYDSFAAVFGQARTERCFKPTTGVPAPTPLVEAVLPPTRRPTAPIPPTAAFEVVIGSSTVNTKIVQVEFTDVECPTEVSRDNWLGDDVFGDRFAVSVSGSSISVRRVDAEPTSGWGMNLRIQCFRPVDCLISRRYLPQDDIAGEGRTSESSAAQCQERCKRVAECWYFTYWPDGGCHLTSQAGKPTPVGDLISGHETCILPNAPPTVGPTARPTSLVAPTPVCDETLAGENGAGYRGCQSVTVGGYTCANWTSQSPHQHNRTPRNFPNKGLGDHNNCRNPDGDRTIWCYTTDPAKRFDYCEPRTASPTPAPTTPSPTLQPTPAPTLPSGTCETFLGRDIASGFVHHAQSQTTGITTDAACRELCNNADGCRAWVRQPSTDTCWLTTQRGTIPFKDAADRNAGFACRTESPSVCECSGRSFGGIGGSGCNGDGGRWCYTDFNACPDGQPSTVLADQEWSSLACATA